MNTEIKFTRKDYLDGNCTHEQYYAQFVTSWLTGAVLSTFTQKELKEAFEKDSNLNSIPLSTWDRLAKYAPSDRFKKCGDYLTLAGGVCAAKEAARQIASL